MSRDLLFRILVPMLILLIIFSALHFWTKGDDFFINLVVEIIGIIITALYVDYILKRHEERRKRMLWKEAERRIISNLERFIYDFLIYIIGLFGYRLREFLEEYKWDNGLGLLVNTKEQFVKFSKEVLEKEANKKIKYLTHKDWQEFIEEMKGFLDSANKIFTTFGDKLTPQQYALFMDIQYFLNSIINQYANATNSNSRESIGWTLGAVLITIRELNDTIIYKFDKNGTLVKTAIFS